MRRITLKIGMWLLLGTVTAVWGAGPSEEEMTLEKKVLTFQKKASSAAKLDASKQFSEGSPQFTAQLRKALNATVAASSTGDSIKRIGTSTTLARTSLMDRDERYRKSVATLVFGGESVGNRIWGGLPTSGFSSTVAISGLAGQLCTGTLISSRAVLTAQHCHCGGANAQVSFGSVFDPSKPGIKVLQSVPMKACDHQVSEAADVAVLVLDRDADPSVTPAVLASSRLIDGAAVVRVVGFGKDQNGGYGRKNFVDVPMASPSCLGSVPASDGTRVPDASYYGCNAKFELVAGAPLLDKDTCNGDSGGPAFVRGQDGNEYLAAATSRGVITPGSRPCGDGGIYVRVDGDIRIWLEKQGVKITIAQ
jgi:secreted trypsin-like serine protease